MAKAAGRDQRGPMERVVRILIALTESGADGLSAQRLRQIADLPDNESGITQLRRDLRQLRNDGGWDIESFGEEGVEGHYMLHAQDNRLELLLTAGERAALQQASAAVGTDIHVPPAGLAALEHAVERHCQVHFSYKHQARTVHPYALHNGPSGWMLRGREVESDTVKEFVVDRIAGRVEMDDPGTSEVPGDIPRHEFDPLTWPMDPPEIVTISTTTDFADEALQLLTGSRVVHQTDEELIIETLVTHRAAFCSRMAELGVRVRFVGQSATAEQMITRLRGLADAKVMEASD